MRMAAALLQGRAQKTVQIEGDARTVVDLGTMGR